VLRGGRRVDLGVGGSGVDTCFDVELKVSSLLGAGG
jgi:hypothetical protein